MNINNTVTSPKKNTTICQDVVDEIKRLIFEGYFVPGQRLVYSELAEQMGVSTTPVREALNTLKSSGIVTMDPHHTPRVSVLEIDEIQQLYQIRKLLEGAATRLSAENINKTEVRALRHILVETDGDAEVLKEAKDHASKLEIIRSMEKKHGEFHTRLYACSKNKYLCILISEVRSLVSPYLPLIGIYSLDRGEDGQREHHMILDACEQRNIELAGKTMEEHLNHSLIALVSYLKNTNYNIVPLRLKNRTKKNKRNSPNI